MRTLIVIGLALAFLAGCSRIPEPVGYDYSVQPKMQAAYHWDVLASDVANRINNELVIHDYVQTPVYVRPTCGDESNPCEQNHVGTFNEAFRDLLITELVRFGVPVQQYDDEEAITIHYKVQLIKHNSYRIRTIQPGVMTAIATGIMVLRNAPIELQAIAAAGVLDFMNASSVDSSAHEVIITTSMITNDRYLFRTSDIYYINDKDFRQYMDSPAGEAVEIPLTSPHQLNALPVAKPKPAPMRNDPQPITSDEATLLPDI